MNRLFRNKILFCFQYRAKIVNLFGFIYKGNNGKGSVVQKISTIQGPGKALLIPKATSIE